MTDENDLTALSPLQRAVIGLKEARAHIAEMRRAQTEPIAIVGMACRYPGAPDLSAFWRLVSEGRSALTEIPSDRWDKDAYFDPDLAPGTMNTKRGGFVEGIDRFDPGFFDLSLAEARGMDPQQRMLLECTHRALEHAGIAPDGLRGSASGVFVGISTFDYLRMAKNAPSRAGTGVVHSIAANRISYLFDLRGPSFAIDTACSSSLLAAHLAMRSLRARECNLAVVGGVNAILTPDATVGFAQAGMLSSDGLCKSFDASADGYVRGEGCGVILLKRLSDAERDGDRVVAILRGSATNQDGRSNGLTAPNGTAQVAVIGLALKDASLAPTDVSYVEAHGTGTAIGDAIEAQALTDALGDRDPTSPCIVGCVKGNIGHLEAGAGVAAILKVALSLEHQRIPALPHLKNRNPAIPENAPLLFPSEARAWPRGDQPRRAGVSGFGFGGANVHLVMEEAPQRSPHDEASSWTLLPLSGRTDAALLSTATACGAALEASPPNVIDEAAHTLGGGRAHYSHRAALVVSGVDDARAQLAQLADRGGHAVRGVVARGAAARVALFARGARPALSSGALNDVGAPFHGALLAAREACRSASSRRTGDESALASFALEYALGTLWKSWVPLEAICGEGHGAWVAACIAGAISLESGASLVASDGDAAVAVTPPLVRLVLGAMSFAPGGDVDPALVVRACRGESAANAGVARPTPTPTSAYDAVIDLGAGTLLESERHQPLPARPSMDAGRSGRRALLETAAALYVRGARLEWSAITGAAGRRGYELPGHPFDRKTCWLEPNELVPLTPPPRPARPGSAPCPVEKGESWIAMSSSK